MWTDSQKLPNGISVCRNAIGNYWIASIIFQREQFEARGESMDDAVKQLAVHIENVIPVWEWKIEHNKNVLDDMRNWLERN